MALSEYTCVRKLCLAPRHSGRDAFSRAIIFLLRSVTKYYSLTLKITASVLHGLCKCVRELMVSDNRWLTLCTINANSLFASIAENEPVFAKTRGRGGCNSTGCWKFDVDLSCGWLTNCVLGSV